MLCCNRQSHGLAESFAEAAVGAHRKNLNDAAGSFYWVCLQASNASCSETADHSNNYAGSYHFEYIAYLVFLHFEH